MICQQDLEDKLINSIEHNNLDRLEEFLTAGYHVNSCVRCRNSIWDTNCFTILAIAAYSGSYDIVEYLLKRNVNVNQTDLIKHRTALHWAVVAGHYSIVKMLVESGANVNARDRDSVTPLILASAGGGGCGGGQQMPIVRLLIKAGANVNAIDRWKSSALHYATTTCCFLNAALARELVMHGCKSMHITFTGHQFRSPLKLLVGAKQYFIAKMLLESSSVDELKKEESIATELWLRSHLANVPSLASLCRRRIRNQLGSQHLFAKINILNIPKYLIDYLKMKF